MFPNMLENFLALCVVCSDVIFVVECSPTDRSSALTVNCIKFYTLVNSMDEIEDLHDKLTVNSKKSFVQTNRYCFHSMSPLQYR